MQLKLLVGSVTHQVDEDLGESKYTREKELGQFAHVWREETAHLLEHDLESLHERQVILAIDSAQIVLVTASYAIEGDLERAQELIKNNDELGLRIKSREEIVDDVSSHHNILLIDNALLVVRELRLANLDDDR